jgi:hypothetical protein
MREELLNLIKRETSNLKFGEYLLDNNLKRIDRYLENYEILINNLKRLKTKYNYKNINEWSEYPEDCPHLTLFKSMTETTLTLCIDYEGGISPSDKELSPLIEDAMIYIEPEFEKKEDEYYYVDMNDQIHNQIFLTILSNAWIKSKGHECGLVVKTLENNSVESFYLNDLKWNQLSKFQHFYDKSKPVKNLYKDSIDINEIYRLVSKRWIK